jgi:hypothetical protein
MIWHHDTYDASTQPPTLLYFTIHDFNISIPCCICIVFHSIPPLLSSDLEHIHPASLYRFHVELSSLLYNTINFSCSCYLARTVYTQMYSTALDALCIELVCKEYISADMAREQIDIGVETPGQ